MLTRFLGLMMSRTVEHDEDLCLVEQFVLTMKLQLENS